MRSLARSLVALLLRKSATAAGGLPAARCAATTRPCIRQRRPPPDAPRPFRGARVSQNLSAVSLLFWPRARRARMPVSNPGQGGKGQNRHKNTAAGRCPAPAARALAENDIAAAPRLCAVFRLSPLAVWLSSWLRTHRRSSTRAPLTRLTAIRAYSSKLTLASPLLTQTELGLHGPLTGRRHGLPR